MATLDFEHEQSEFRRLYRIDSDLFRSALSSYKGLVRALLSGRDDFPTPVVTGRIKDCEEAITKFVRKYRNELEEAAIEYEIFDHVTDLLGVRVICYYESDVPKIQRLLEENFDVISITDKNHELASDPNSFGYKGVHLDLRLNETRRVLPEFQGIKDYKFELQLRTTVQHSWAEIEHKISYKRSVPGSLRHRIVRLAGLFELADQEFEEIRKETAELIAEAHQDTPAKADKEFDEQLLNAVYCDAVMEKIFDDYLPNPEYADIFVTEVKRLHPEITVGEFVESVTNHQEKIHKYQQVVKEKSGRNLNPFTRMRHMLFASDPKRYESILFPHVRKRYDDWLSNTE